VHITYGLAIGNGTNNADNGSFVISGNSLRGRRPAAPAPTTCTSALPMQRAT
jgi:hypothetical protein